MGFLSDRALRVSALAVAISGWIVAMAIAGKGVEHTVVPAGTAALAASIPRSEPAPEPLLALEPVRVRTRATSKPKSIPVPVKANVAAPKPAPAAIPRPAVAAPIAIQPQPVALQPDAPVEGETRRPGLALVGITGVKDRDSAWIVDLATGERQVAAVGDAAFGYEVKSIRPDGVTLVRNAQEYDLRLGPIDVQSTPGRRPAGEATARPMPSSAGVTVNTPVTVNTYVNVYPPDYAAEERDEAREARDARYSRHPYYDYASPVTPVVVIFGGNGRSGRSYNRSRGYGYPSTRSTRQRSGRVTGAADEALTFPEPIVNPQTVRRMGLSAATDAGRYQPGYSGSSRTPAISSRKWLSTR